MGSALSLFHRLAILLRRKNEPAGDGDVSRGTGAWHQDAPAALAADRASGKLMRNSAPLLAWFSADIWPSCASMMVRAMDNPIPMHLGLVV